METVLTIVIVGAVVALVIFLSRDRESSVRPAAPQFKGIDPQLQGRAEFDAMDLRLQKAGTFYGYQTQCCFHPDAQHPESDCNQYFKNTYQQYFSTFAAANGMRAQMMPAYQTFQTTKNATMKDLENLRALITPINQQLDLLNPKP